jgi:hypothetical protein
MSIGVSRQLDKAFEDSIISSPNEAIEVFEHRGVLHNRDKFIEEISTIIIHGYSVEQITREYKYSKQEYQNAITRPNSSARSVEWCEAVADAYSLILDVKRRFPSWEQQLEYFRRMRFAYRNVSNDTEEFRDNLRKEFGSATPRRKNEITGFFDMIAAKESCEKVDSEVDALKQSIKEIPNYDEVGSLEEKIKEINLEIFNLGFFKGKEKKALQEKMSEYQAQLSKSKPSVEKKTKEIMDLISEKITQKKGYETTLQDYKLIGEAFTRKERNSIGKK